MSCGISHNIMTMTTEQRIGWKQSKVCRESLNMANENKYPSYPSSIDAIPIPTLGSILSLIRIDPNDTDEDGLHQKMSLGIAH